MKGKIDKDGYLHIERNNGFRQQLCPFSEQANCGQWCPHFGDPEERSGVPLNYTKNGEPIMGFDLRICHGKTLVFETLEIEE